MSPISNATSPSTLLPAYSPSSLPGRAKGSLPSNPRIRKAPQRVGKSASAIFFTLSKAISPFYVAAICVQRQPSQTMRQDRKQGGCPRELDATVRGRIHWRRDQHPYLDHASGETGRGCGGGERIGAVAHVPAAAVCR